MPHGKFFGNDPAFGIRKQYHGKTEVGSRNQPLPSAPTATQSEYTADPHYIKGIMKDPYQGTRDLLPKPDFYSNPNPNEHVRGWPTRTMEKGRQGQETLLLYGLAILVGGIILLKLFERTSVNRYVAPYGPPSI